MGPEGAQGPKGDRGEQGPAGPGSSGHVYRWNTFSPFDASTGVELERELLGGVNGATWRFGMRASWLSSDKDLLRTLFTRKGYPGKNALVFAEARADSSLGDELWAVVLFRVRNSTQDPINWPLTWQFSSYGSGSQYASCAFNGAELFLSNQNQTRQTRAFQVTVPPDSIGTLICVAPPGPTYNFHPAIRRMTYSAFIANSLLMPAGLALVDDLDTATGGWGR
jgi:hypothetical protein